MKLNSTVWMAAAAALVVSACSIRVGATMLKDWRGVYRPPPPAMDAMQYKPSAWPNSNLQQLGDLVNATIIEGVAFENVLGAVRYSFTLADNPDKDRPIKVLFAKFHSEGGASNNWNQLEDWVNQSIDKKWYASWRGRTGYIEFVEEGKRAVLGRKLQVAVYYIEVPASYLEPDKLAEKIDQDILAHFKELNVDKSLELKPETGSQGGS